MDSSWAASKPVQSVFDIRKLLHFPGLIIHHTDKDTKKSVLASCKVLEYGHEQHTSKKLNTQDYHVLFTPKGYFKRSEKKHDVFLIKRHLILEADLKCIYSKNPDTISNRIKEGSDQASRVVLDIHSDIEKIALIDGIRSGCIRNDFLQQILLFYRSKFFMLNKDQILGRNILNIIK